MKKTPWYPNAIKPVRNGCYETRSIYGISLHMDKWNGRQWSDEYGFPINQDSVHQWRGLAEKPKC